MRVVVVGAGGLGSFIGAALAAAHEVTLVARGAHAAEIERSGLLVDTVAGPIEARPRCVSTAHDVAGGDLAFVSVKAFSLDEVGDQVARLARDGAVVVPLLNGVEASARLVGLGVPGDRLVDGVAYITAFRTGPGRISKKGAHQRLVIGSYTGAGADAIDVVRTAFEPTDVEIEPADDILPELWKKMAVVCSLSVVCALSGESMGPIRTHVLGAELQRRAIAEVIRVGRARDVDLPPDTEARIGAVLDAFPEDFHPSVIHDLKSRRPTEMEDLGGAIVRMARDVGVEVPLHEAATVSVQLAEQRSAGAG